MVLFLAIHQNQTGQIKAYPIIILRGPEMLRMAFKILSKGKTKCHSFNYLILFILKNVYSIILIFL